MQKRQKFRNDKNREKKWKERKKEREMEMQAQGLTASHCGWEASTMLVSIPKKKKNSDMKLNL